MMAQNDHDATSQTRFFDNDVGAEVEKERIDVSESAPIPSFERNASYSDRVLRARRKHKIWKLTQQKYRKTRKFETGETTIIYN